ncbi:MAG: hypothetical protein U5K31_02715 [Balneolaceae bacterium]|nr:hypothetical protein [Balneolaceae bacterium]
MRKQKFITSGILRAVGIRERSPNSALPDTWRIQMENAVGQVRKAVWSERGRNWHREDRPILKYMSENDCDIFVVKNYVNQFPEIIEQLFNQSFICLELGGRIRHENWVTEEFKFIFLFGADIFFPASVIISVP